MQKNCVAPLWIKNSKPSLATNMQDLAFYIGCIFLLHFLISCGQSPNATSGPTIEKPKPIQPKVSTQIEPRNTSVETKTPTQKIDYDTSQWSEIIFQEKEIELDLRYATANNFVDEQMYDCPRCFLRPEAARALSKVSTSLQKKGYYLKLFDCYRPKSIQEKLWQKVPNATYVTPPEKGSMHNRGFAIDATLVDMTGQEVDMGTDFDFFGREAHHDNRSLDTTVLMHRGLLKSTMAEFGFKHIRTEWWHYAYRGPYQSPFKLADFQWDCDTPH